jgi:hypothetical protein
LFVHAKDLFVEANPWISLTKSRSSIKGSGNLLPSSPPAEKSTASEDQARKSGTSDWAGHADRRTVRQVT